MGLHLPGAVLASGRFCVRLRYMECRPAGFPKALGILPGQAEPVLRFLFRLVPSQVREWL